MILVIAEKHSVAQNLAAVLGAKKREQSARRGTGFFIAGDGYIVSWCVGHLAGLANAEIYNPDYAKWRLEDLPILPEKWQFIVREDRRKQFNILRELMHREDVDEVINCCDAGREGELVYRVIYGLAGCKKPTSRMWISSMTDEAIRDGFQNLRPGSDYDGLYQSALCRAKADWAVGISATRLMSIIYHKTLNVGRVMSPTLALIVQREAEISAFTTVPFYTVNLDCGGFIAGNGKYKNKAEAEAVATACQGKTGIIKSIERKEKSENPPALYDLTTLQRDANRLLGYTAQQTLDYLQALYEKQCSSYPRSGSRYLTADMESTVPALAAVAAAVCGLPAPEEIRADQVCDSAKVTDHHAIVPTRSAGKTDISTLPIGEREILKLISLGLLGAVSGAHQYTETAVTLECGGYLFTAKGKEDIDIGWRSYLFKGSAARLNDETPESPLLSTLPPELSTVNVDSIAIKDGKTSPPPHFTEDTILAAMETAGAKDFSVTDDTEHRGLGTPATRAAILEKLVSTGFVERRKAKKAVHLLPTPTGISLISVLPEQLQSPQLTANWEHQLKQIERNELDPAVFMDGISAMLRELVQTYEPVQGVLFPSERESVGKCPRCGKYIYENKKAFSCEDRSCGFFLWKESRFFTTKRKELTKPIVSALLKDGRVELKDCYSERTCKTYDATIILEDDGNKTVFKIEFGGK